MADSAFACLLLDLVYNNWFSVFLWDARLYRLWDLLPLNRDEGLSCDHSYPSSSKVAIREMYHHKKQAIDLAHADEDGSRPFGSNSSRHHRIATECL